MANQVAARLSGDDYQHLYAWQFALELFMPKKNVRMVTVEDALAGSVDDITVQHEEGTQEPDCFYQIKYHVDYRGEYSTAELIKSKPGYTSLLEKFWNTWKMLVQQNPQRVVLLHLVSNWTWDAQDKLKSCISGVDVALTDEFFSATPKTDVGKLRLQWQTKLGVSDTEFFAFCRCLRFRLGFDCSDELEKRVSERMENLGLKFDTSALKIAVGIVREWIKKGKQVLTRAELEESIKSHDLYLPKESERCVALYLTTIKAQKFDIEPDYVIDWRDYFVGDPLKKGHQLVDPTQWNSLLQPELQTMEARVNQETDCRLIRARGLARLSAWFAFGFTFSDVARYTIEVDQGGAIWRTDAKTSPDFRMLSTNSDETRQGEALDGTGSTVAVGISVTGLLDDDARAHLNERTEPVSALLLLRPERALGRECLRNAGDVVSLADISKSYMRAFVKQWKATRLLLYYFGPLSGACFIGHRLNAVCQQVQIMEDQQPGYSPSFLLQ